SSAAAHERDLDSPKRATGCERHRTRRDQGNEATGVSDMAGYAARVAVEPSGSERDTMELLGKATWPVTPRGKQRASVGGERVSMELAGKATHLRRGYGAPGIEH